MLRRIVAESSQRKVASTIGTFQQKVSVWCREGLRPPLLYQHKLSVAYGIPLEAWLTATEKEMVEKLRREHPDPAAVAAREALDSIQQAAPPKPRHRKTAAGKKRPRAAARTTPQPAVQTPADAAEDTRTLPLFPGGEARPS